MDWRLLFLPVVSGLIGWFTNVLAVKMMFRPRQPVKLPFFPVTIQGLLPTRQKDIARTIGETIERELLSINSLLDQLDIEGYREEIIRTVINHIDRRLNELLPPFIPGNIKAALGQMLADLVRRESRLLLTGITKKVTDKLTDEVQIGKLAEEKILSLDFTELERLVIEVASRELRHIEIFGAILGFIIGLAQLGILLFIR